jgi:ATP/maltotriose-dependent transcriptional regulator MalT/DNA-binding SARP family transcriptional activator
MKKTTSISGYGGPLLAKLQMPALKPGTLLRSRLVDDLANNLDRRLLVITADAGYGKTTLLAQLKERAHLPCVYMALEPEDGDLVTFFSGLVWGLERVQPGLARRCRGMVEQGTDIGRNHRLAMGTLLNELVEKRNEELFFILDDYHSLADDSGVHQALDYFTDHLPPNVHLLIASRREPPLPSLPKWRAKRDLAELSREALRFTARDIKDLMDNSYNLAVSDKDLEGIADRTEGWVTGVQLILHAAGRDGRPVGQVLGSFLEEQGDLFRYFAGEIYSREDRERKDLMRRSSVLDNMTADSCRFVLELKNPDKSLSDLAQSNLFVAGSPENGYRYHRLFREFLYEQLADPAEKSRLHGRAARYCEKSGDAAGAIGHYLAAGDYDETVRLIGAERERLINRAQFGLLRSWLDKLPPRASHEYPWLYALQAVLLKEKGSLEQAESLYLQADKELAEKGVKDSSRAYVLYEKSIVLHRKGEYRPALETLKEAGKYAASASKDLQSSILGFTAQVWLEGLGGTSEARACLSRARKLLSHTSNSMQIVYIEQKKAVLLESLGEKRQAFGVYKGIIERIGDNYSHLAGSYFHNAAKVALDYGRYDWAEQCLNRGSSLCRGYEDIFSESMLEFGFGYLYLFKGDWERSHKHLTKTLDTFQGMNWTRSVCIALRQLSRLGRYRGDPAMAQRYLDQMKQQPLGPLDRVAVLLEQSLIDITNTDYPMARENLEACRADAIKYFGKMGEIICHLAEAGINAGQKRNREAALGLGKAVLLAKDHGFDGLLACELRASPELGRLALKSQGEKAYLLTIPAFVLMSKEKRPEPETVLAIELLGPPRVVISGRDQTSSFRRQTRELLCLLAYHNARGLDRDGILQAMWPSVGLNQAVDSFHLAMFELRSTLRKILGKGPGKTIVKEAGRYMISRDLPVKCDASDLNELWEQAKEAERTGDQSQAKMLMERSLQMMRGTFGSGWGGNWVQQEARRYEEIQQRILLKLGTLCLRNSEMEPARDNYRRALERDELCEEAVRGLMRIHAAAGRHSESRAVYEKFRKTLRRELQTEPSRETQELYRNLKTSAGN